MRGTGALELRSNFIDPGRGARVADAVAHDLHGQRGAGAEASQGHEKNSGGESHPVILNRPWPQAYGKVGVIRFGASIGSPTGSER